MTPVGLENGGTADLRRLVTGRVGFIVMTDVLTAAAEDVTTSRAELVAAHRELCEASDAVRHLLVVENLTQSQVDVARTRLSRAYERAAQVDNDALRV